MVLNVVIKATAGAGGSGVVAFEKIPHKPVGRPIGGSGGAGADIVIEADERCENLSNLQRDFYRSNRGGCYARGQNGGHGGHKGESGRGAKAVVIRVPVGASVCGFDGRAKRELGLLVDELEHGERFIIAKGGRGGRGNRMFQGSQNRTPLLAEAGADGEERFVSIRANIKSDAAFVGLDASGKAEVIARLTGARPKSDYAAFAHGEPTLNYLANEIYKFKILDLPLAPNALDNARHLRYANFTILVLSDGAEKSAAEQADLMLSDIRAADIEPDELKIAFLINRAAAKPVSKAALNALRKLADAPCLDVNLSDEKSVAKLKSDLFERLARSPAAPRDRLNDDELPVVRPIAAANESRENVIAKAGAFVITHKTALMLAKGSDLNDMQALAQFRAKLRDFGVIRELEDKGVQLGDAVKVAGWEFEWT